MHLIGALRPPDINFQNWQGGNTREEGQWRKQYGEQFREEDRLLHYYYTTSVS